MSRPYTYPLRCHLCECRIDPNGDNARCPESDEAICETCVMDPKVAALQSAAIKVTNASEASK